MIAASASGSTFGRSAPGTCCDCGRFSLALSSRQKAAETPNCSTDTSAGSGTARRTVLFTSSIEAEMSEYATSAAMWLGAGASALALEPDIGCCSIGMYSGFLLCHDAASSASQRAERVMHWRARRHAIPHPNTCREGKPDTRTPAKAKPAKAKLYSSLAGWLGVGC